jgi:peptidoglycan/LPS O-acetylase OafA/YrhL
MQKQGYPSLDIVRFSAALMVALFHLSYHSWHNPTTPEATYLEQNLLGIGRFFTSGYIGVPIFFVLSGFVIAFSANEKDVFEFLKSRILRLYPAAWICATITAIVIIGDPDWFRKYINSLVLWPAEPWVDGVYWTLVVEMTFYCFVAMLLATVGSKYLTELGYVLGLISSGFWLARAADFVLGKPFGGVFSFLESEIGNLLTNGCYFGLGIMVWKLSSSGYSKMRMLTAIICIVAGIIATVSSARYKFIDQAGPKHDMLVTPLIWLVAVGCIAASAYWNKNISVILAHFRAPLRTIGLATYPLYLVHEVFGIAIMEATSPYVGAKISFAIALFFALLIAWAVVYLEVYPKIMISRFLSVLLPTFFPVGSFKPKR